MVKGDSNENIVQSWTCVSTETPSTYLMACVRDATSLPYASRASSSCPHESASIALSYSFRHFRRSNRSEDELFDGDPERITATGPRAPVLSCPCRAQPRAPTHKSKSVLHQPHSASLPGTVWLVPLSLLYLYKHSLLVAQGSSLARSSCRDWSPHSYLYFSTMHHDAPFA